MDPGVSYFDEVFERLAPIYEASVLCPMTAPIMRKIKEYMEEYGIQYGVIKAAVEETGLAPRPSARYLLAILKRVALDGITTVDEWAQEKEEHERNNYNRMRRAYPDGLGW